MALKAKLVINSLLINRECSVLPGLGQPRVNPCCPREIGFTPEIILQKMGPGRSGHVTTFHLVMLRFMCLEAHVGQLWVTGVHTDWPDTVSNQISSALLTHFDSRDKELRVAF